MSLVATVKNESSSIGAWLRAIESQTRLPDETIIVDAGSTDGCWEHLCMWTPMFPVLVLQVAGVNISQGRNAAIERASGIIIAVTDAGTVAEPEWLERLVESLRDERVDVSAGFFRPQLDSYWARGLAAATLPDSSEIDIATFQPSSRSVAFRRTWWEAGIRYPEWLDFCEDLVWDLALRRAGARFHFADGAVVTYHVRPTLGEYLRQYFRYARGDGKAGLFARRHALRYFAYSALLLALARGRHWECMVLAGIGALYVRRPVERLLARDRSMGRSMRDTALTVPLVLALRAAGDLAKIAGYPVGLTWRVRVMGGPCWRATWRRVNPDGKRFLPSTMSRGTQQPSSSPACESPRDST
ncbi:MAG TPA: glycosyltransferase [Thermomicrobiales bacterium]|nr:glycosyltransferase [Thermomicrobiales bacterium]